jgi:hypothetical protein
VDREEAREKLLRQRIPTFTMHTELGGLRDRGATSIYEPLEPVMNLKSKETVLPSMRQTNAT